MPESSSIKGLRKNMFNIIDGQNVIHDNAILNDEPLAKDGVTAAVKGPGKTIIDTGYYEMNEFVGLHQLKLRWFSNISPGEGLIVQYWKKDKNGIETHRDMKVKWYGDLSPVSGNGIGDCYFTPNAQYRIKIISSPTLGLEDIVSVDYIGLMPSNEWNVSAPIYAGPRSLYTNNDRMVVNGNGTPVASAHYSYEFPELYNGLSASDIYIAYGVYDSTGTSLVNITNKTLKGFDVVVRDVTGNWTGGISVDLTISAFIYPLIL